MQPELGTVLYFYSPHYYCASGSTPVFGDRLVVQRHRLCLNASRYENICSKRQLRVGMLRHAVGGVVDASLHHIVVLFSSEILFIWYFQNASLHSDKLCTQLAHPSPSHSTTDQRDPTHACFSSGNASHAKHASCKRSQVLRLRYVTRCLQPTRIYRHGRFSEEHFRFIILYR